MQEQIKIHKEGGYPLIPSFCFIMKTTKRSQPTFVCLSAYGSSTRMLVDPLFHVFFPFCGEKKCENNENNDFEKQSSSSLYQIHNKIHFSFLLILFVDFRFTFHWNCLVNQTFSLFKKKYF